MSIKRKVNLIYKYGRLNFIGEDDKSVAVSEQKNRESVKAETKTKLTERSEPKREAKKEEQAVSESREPIENNPDVEGEGEDQYSDFEQEDNEEPAVDDRKSVPTKTVETDPRSKGQSVSNVNTEREQQYSEVEQDDEQGILIKEPAREPEKTINVKRQTPVQGVKTDRSSKPTLTEEAPKEKKPRQDEHSGSQQDNEQVILIKEPAHEPERTVNVKPQTPIKATKTDRSNKSPTIVEQGNDQKVQNKEPTHEPEKNVNVRAQTPIKATKTDRSIKPPATEEAPAEVKADQGSTSQRNMKSIKSLKNFDNAVAAAAPESEETGSISTRSIRLKKALPKPESMPGKVDAKTVQDYQPGRTSAPKKNAVTLNDSNTKELNESKEVL